MLSFRATFALAATLATFSQAAPTLKPRAGNSVSRSKQYIAYSIRKVV